MRKSWTAEDNGRAHLRQKRRRGTDMRKRGQRWRDCLCVCVCVCGPEEAAIRMSVTQEGGGHQQEGHGERSDNRLSYSDKLI